MPLMCYENTVNLFPIPDMQIKVSLVMLLCSCFLLLNMAGYAQSKNKNRKRQAKEISKFASQKKPSSIARYDPLKKSGRVHREKGAELPCPDLSKVATKAPGGRSSGKTVFISGMGEPDPVTASGGEQPVPVLTENTIFKPRMIVPDSVPAARTMAELLPEIPQLRPLYFVFDQDELTREDLQTIHTAARYARQGFAIVIEGHTDDLGSHTYNQQLSLKRAQRIREIMVQQTGLSADSIEVKALGEQFPAVPNASEAQRRLNRRVEIKVKGKE